MAYLGNTPAARFSAMDKQTITGDGTTGPYTLTHSVGNEQEIEVFVNNVRQEPSVAYTVSGTDLTMTGNVASTDNFYVVFQGLAQQTATHPSSSALQATTGTFSSNVDVGGSLLVDTIKEGTGTNTALSIGSNGLIQPKQVAFQVTADNTDQSVSAVTATKVEWETVLDTGSYWDATDHRFTPQVAGWYMFSCAIRVQLLNIHEYVRIYISKNGHPLTDLNSAFTTQLQTNNDELIGGVYLGPTVMHQLNGSTDYVEVFFYTDEATVIHENAQPSFFNGFLVHAT